jgi:hypothetical protein
MIENYKIQDNENKYMKIYSKAKKDPESKDYKKGLGLNLSTALYHNIKELQLKY